jgi:hypothetical protein
MLTPHARVSLDGVTMIGATGTLRTNVVPPESTLAVSGRSAGPPELLLDGAAIPVAYPLERPGDADDASAARGFAALLPRPLAEGAHRIEARDGDACDAIDVVVVPETARPDSLGQLDLVRAGSDMVFRRRGEPLEAPAAHALAF